MNKFVLTCTLAASVFAFSHSAHAASTYTVKSGDSLWKLSQTYHVSINELKNINHLTSDTIKIGEQLTIPATSLNNTRAISYTVKTGDSLWTIGQKYNLSIKQLQSANQLQSSIIQPGQHLVIPLISSLSNASAATFASKPMTQSTTPQPSTNSNQYVVKSGDTLWGIAMANGTPISLIKSTNHLSTSTIAVGQRLTIPQLLTTAEKTLLAHLVTAEAKGEPYKGQVAVATVVLNRVDSPEFPNTVKGVIYQSNSSGSYAFTPVKTGSINQPVASSAVKAVNEALAMRDVYKKAGSLFFYNPKIITNDWILSRPVTTTIGNHVFAK